MSVVPDSGGRLYNQSVPPDTLWLRFPENKGDGVTKNKTFSYSFRGEIYKQDNEIDLKVIAYYKIILMLTEIGFFFYCPLINLHFFPFLFSSISLS